MLETMIVTAQKKEENVQNVPGSVSVLGDLQIEEDNLYSQGDYMIANARLGYQIDAFGVCFYMKNAFDKTYYTFANRRGGVDKGILGAPRTFGIQASLRF